MLVEKSQIENMKGAFEIDSLKIKNRNNNSIQTIPVFQEQNPKLEFPDKVILGVKAYYSNHFLVFVDKIYVS